ncbi:hypothetical protein BC834DRAFT_600938 [Gloeopeniophorella convolvens]|nr:hypothetical protein BC834DRAFT_600938 [Gloeopeniophorella convolvens]
MDAPSLIRLIFILICVSEGSCERIENCRDGRILGSSRNEARVMPGFFCPPLALWASHQRCLRLHKGHLHTLGFFTAGLGITQCYLFQGVMDPMIFSLLVITAGLRYPRFQRSPASCSAQVRVLSEHFGPTYERWKKHQPHQYQPTCDRPA